MAVSPAASLTSSPRSCPAHGRAARCAARVRHAPAGSHDWVRRRADDVCVCVCVYVCVCVCVWGGHLASHGGRRTATLRLPSADLPPPPPHKGHHVGWYSMFAAPRLPVSGPGRESLAAARTRGILWCLSASGGGSSGSAENRDKKKKEETATRKTAARTIRLRESGLPTSHFPAPSCKPFGPPSRCRLPSRRRDCHFAAPPLSIE